MNAEHNHVPILFALQFILGNMGANYPNYQKTTVKDSKRLGSLSLLPYAIRVQLIAKM